MERWHAKVIAGVVMLFAILGCFLLPIKLTVYFRRRGDNGQYFLDLLACFAGGVFLAAYLIFMAPAVRELLLESLMKPYAIEYPIPDMLIGIGFFILLLLNRVVVSLSKFSKRRRHRHMKENDDAELRNGKSLTTSSSAATQLTTVSSNGELLEPLHAEDSRHEKFVEAPVGPDEFSIEVAIPDDADDYPHDRNSPYPLPRRSSITDVAHQDSMTRSIIMMLALSLDSVFEGITTGLKTTNVEVWAIFIGNLVHETVIAFCLGLQLVRVHEKTTPVVMAAIAYSLMNPVGLVVATAIYETRETDARIDIVNGVLQALTSGCFIYVTFCEILEGQITHNTSYAKIASLFIGFAVLAIFAAVPGSSSYSFITEAASNVTVSPP